MKEVKFLSKYDKEIIAKFINHQLKRDNLKDSWSMKDKYKYELCEEFIYQPKDDVRRCHFGMQFILEMMLHQLPLYPTEKEYMIKKGKDDKHDAKILNEM